jgi:hypothetical protein
MAPGGMVAPQRTTEQTDKQQLGEIKTLIEELLSR